MSKDETIKALLRGGCIFEEYAAQKRRQKYFIGEKEGAWLITYGEDWEYLSARRVIRQFIKARLRNEEFY